MNLEQSRAARAFAAMQRVAGLDWAEGSLRLAQALPAWFQTNGLLATWAHLLAKRAKRPENGVLLAALLGHLRALGLAPATGDEESALTGWWTAPGTGAAGRELRRVTAETIAYSVWLKRAAEALLDQGAPGGAPPPAEGARRP